MLTLHPEPGRLRRAHNLIPTAKPGGMATRPGAYQVIAGDITAAAPWGDRVLVEKAGRIALWTGSEDIDLAPAGRVLEASSFQALTSDAQREDRLYFVDGVNPLRYIARRSGAYGVHGVTNKVKDADGIAYPLPISTAIASWRGRLWLGYGGNRVRHCQFDDTEYWDPLWTPELQGDVPDRVVGFQPYGAELRVGMVASQWQITGDSHLNWSRNQSSTYGTAGPRALTAVGDPDNGGALYWLSAVGLHQAGRAEPLSEDISKAFEGSPYPCELVADRRRSLLLLLVGGRLFVMHLAQPGRFGEIVGHQVRGLIQTTHYTGWFGGDGVWFLGARDLPDERLGGARTAFASVYDTWPDIPNPSGGGRAKLARTIMVVNGSARAPATYTVTIDDGVNTFSSSATLSDTTPDLWSDALAGLDGEAWPASPVRREFAPYLAGTKFQHRLEAPCHLEVLAFDPQYKFGGEE